MKALSTQELEDLREGRGMGTSKAAELNHYPGPAHVLDAARQLQLTPGQLEKATAIQQSMTRTAKDVGERIVAREAELDALFASRKATPENTRPVVQELGKLYAEFRLAHLDAHIATAQLLEPRQIAHYDDLRGYAAPAGHEGHHHSH